MLFWLFECHLRCVFNLGLTFKIEWFNYAVCELKQPTVYFYFTKIIKGIFRISSRIGRVYSVVVVDYVSPMCDTRDVHMTGNCCPGVVSVLETQNPVLFTGCIWYVDRKSQGSSGKTIVFILNHKEKKEMPSKVQE